MTLTRTMRVLGATALSGALLMTAAPTASADQVRDGQWVNQYYSLDKVWSVSKGDGVIVAVIDTGVDANHQDLAGQVLPGYDPAGQGRDRKPTKSSHGTSMASEIAAKGHGGDAGVVGLAPGAKILPIYQGDANDNNAIPEGIRWAVDHGAKVINISAGKTRTPSGQELAAVAYAVQHDVLVVGAAGNDGLGQVSSPASVPGALAVGAVDRSDTAWKKANYGPETLLSAPGVDMVSAGDCDGGQYCIANGTSDSSAYVSAAAALVRAKYPNLTAGQVANRLVKSAFVPPVIKGAKLPDPHYGYGILRPYEALTMDIPAGSAQGPLAAAASSGGSKAPSAGSSGAASAPPAGSLPPIAASDSGSKGASYLLIGVAVLVGLVLLVVVIVVLARRGRRQSQVQQPYAAPTWQPGQQPYGGQAPPPGYPQQQPYGGEAPQPGFPPHQQQPYQNNPYQDGNQQR
ncbi:S8 family serine peptidase [Kitasatospora sp. MBT63]|uniref:S8 family serine peptidase n=1 Tax=Kitasatospora sp. MBT63 TaxID=1444768 RepID=UPI0006915E28|nr:S8 family serine peptidase [Kitasatospora sp. MBT63]